VIVSVRLPSLKFNQRRRFCYVQFLTSEEARNASAALNDKAVDGQHRLVALLSDPDAKKNRQGATSEGRELYVGNVDHTATDEEIKEAFQEHGQVENVRRLKSANGRLTGTMFVTYATADQADSALALNNKPLKSRLLRVSLATDKSSRDASNQNAAATTVIRNAASPGVSSTADSPAPIEDEAVNGHNVTTATGEVLDHETAHTKRDRTIAILNLPEIVNDARVRAFLEPHGALRKIVVRRDKEGAIVEFASLEDAGKLGMMGLDCSSLGSECRIGTVAELLGRKSRASGPPAKSEGNGTIPKASTTALRPSQVGIPRIQQRGGKRGGLGFKRGGSANVGKTFKKQDEDTEMANDGGSSATVNGQVKKSNADFRAMISGNGGDGSAGAADKDDE